MPRRTVKRKRRLLTPKPVPFIERPATPVQIAKFLQVSPATIGRLVRAQKIPYSRIGRRIRFFPSEVVKWLREQN